VHAKLFALAANAGPAVTLTLFGKTPKLVLLGIPVETTDVLPALGTARDVVLADLSYYTIGSREDFALAYSGEPFFTSNQGVWRLASRRGTIRERADHAGRRVAGGAVCVFELTTN
jgi:hypothetical protein